jgi:hypothetical protein
MKLLAALFSLFLAVPVYALPVFPGADGFGSDTVAGSGRQSNPPNTTICRVTNLNDSGTGSLRSCVEASMPRTCIFEISGVIPTATNLQIISPYISIEGETAPSPGITIRGGQLQALTHDVLIRHLHSRAGDDPVPQAPNPQSRACLTVAGDKGPTYNVVVSHMSLSWSIDTCLNTWYAGLQNITFSDNIVSEPLYDSLHPLGPQSTGIIVAEGAQRLSYLRNLVAHAFSRVPYSKPGVSVEFVNNLVYHQGYGRGGHPNGPWLQGDLSDYDHTGESSYWNIIGNSYRPGPGTFLSQAFWSQASPDNLKGGLLYVHDNRDPFRTTDGEDDWLVVGGALQASGIRTNSPAFPLSNVAALPALQGAAYVIAHSGAFPAGRDSVDSRIVSEVQNGTGQFINCVSADGTARCAANAGGWPVVPEIHRPLTLPPNPLAIQASGYTALEEWLQGYAAQVEGVQTPTPTVTPTATPTRTVTPTATPYPCVTRTPMPTVTPTKLPVCP